MVVAREIETRNGPANKKTKRMEEAQSNKNSVGQGRANAGIYKSIKSYCRLRQLRQQNMTTSLLWRWVRSTRKDHNITRMSSAEISRGRICSMRTSSLRCRLQAKLRFLNSTWKSLFYSNNRETLNLEEMLTQKVKEYLTAWKLSWMDVRLLLTILSNQKS